MEVELMKLDTSPDGDKKVQILGPGDWGVGGAINIHLIHSLIHSFNIHLVSLYYVPSIVLCAQDPVVNKVRVSTLIELQSNGEKKTRWWLQYSDGAYAAMRT